MTKKIAISPNISVTFINFIGKLLPLIFVLILVPIKAEADFWDAVAQCFGDPCNCGIADKIRYESWNGERLDKGKKNYLCAPWNKEDGRHDNICLAGQPYPPVIGSASNDSVKTQGSGYFQAICAEETPESSYFNPKIRVRDQECNIFACWTTDHTLNWNGECVTLAGPYGFPLTRMCARIALPADPNRGTPADPGYTPKKHLNFEGVRVDDDVIIGSDGNPIDVDLPKLCVYLDPGFLEVTNEGVDIDLMDLDPNKQSFHKTAEVHPVVKVILFFLDMATQLSTGLFDLLKSLFDMIGGNQEETTFWSVLSDMFESIGWLIEKVGEGIKSVLEKVGQINRVVRSNDYGCVNIPLGPFPPPFCRQVAPFFQSASVQQICYTGSDGTPVESTENNECTVSNLKNNFINNSIRVGYDNLIPLCKNNQDPMTTDKCVTIDNLGAFSSAKALHLSTARRDILKSCALAASGEPCIKTKVNLKCNVSENGCNQGFRIVYGKKMGKSTIPSNYFRDDLPDCPSSSSIACQEVWGINSGEFIDISLKFPAIQTYDDLGPLADNFTLIDKNANELDFSASIVRFPTFLSTYEFTQQPSQICVFELENVVGCVKRAPPVKPAIYDCASGTGGVSCNSDYFTPKFIAAVSWDSDATSVLVEPLSVYDPLAVAQSSFNLAGYAFESFVTDDLFIRKPFYGSNAPNPSSIYGTYKNNATPVNTDGTINKNAVYLKGLEYINGAYFRGGKYACFESQGLAKCPTDTTICVLSKLTDTNIVDCSIFISKSISYNGLALCNSSFTGCNSVDSIGGLSGGGSGIIINKCDNNSYCYNSPSNEALCQITFDSANRVTPSASFGDIIPDSQYYDIAGVPGYSYDKKLYGLRDKTPIELNQCISIPQPTCAALDSTSVYEANWTAAAIGEVSSGTCPNGSSPKKTMSRYCLVNSNTKTVALEDSGPGYECARLCPAVTVYSATDGNALWTSAFEDEDSTGTCRPGWKASGPLKRKCLIDSNGKPYLEPIGSSQTCAP